jgi:hypothetical protein
MVSLGLGKRSDAIGEVERAGEILERKGALETLDAVADDDIPAGKLTPELFDGSGWEGSFAPPAGCAAFASQSVHGRSSADIIDDPRDR